MLIKLELESDIAIYQQIRHQIIEGMIIGKLKPGEALPSVRQFAMDLGINLHTVNKAYTVLKQDGYIMVHRQKGVVVADTPPGISDEFIGRFKEEIKPQIAEALLRGMQEENLLKLLGDIFKDLKGIS